MTRLPTDASEVEAGLLGATTRPVSGLLLSISCRAAVARRPCWPDRRDPAWFEIRVASASSPSLSERTTTTCVPDFSFLTMPELSQRAVHSDLLWSTSAPGRGEPRRPYHPERGPFPRSPPPVAEALPGSFSGEPPK